MKARDNVERQPHFVSSRELEGCTNQAVRPSFTPAPRVRDPHSLTHTNCVPPHRLLGVQVENKRLVKDMSKWIDSAVKSHEGSAPAQGGHANGGSAPFQGGSALQQAQAAQGEGCSTSEPQACTIS
jgi:hypothetical protein